MGAEEGLYETFLRRVQGFNHPKSLLPSGPTLVELARKHDLTLSTVYGWKVKYAKHAGMSKSNEWTPQKKLEAIVKTASMNENVLGEYLRANDLIVGPRLVEKQLLLLSEASRTPKERVLDRKRVS